MVSKLVSNPIFSYKYGLSRSNPSSPAKNYELLSNLIGALFISEKP